MKIKTVSRKKTWKHALGEKMDLLHARHVRRIQHTVLYVTAIFIHLLWTFFGYSGYLFPGVEHAKAATFSVQTGYYIGSNATKSISGLGFSSAPDLVMIKADTAAGKGVVWKSTSISSTNSNVLDTATADFGSAITSLDSASNGGFTLGTDAGVNALTTTVITRYKWIAFDGSDCSSSGTFCVGSYTGNGAASQTISTGFQPAFVMVKSATTAGQGVWTSSSHASGTAAFFSATANETGHLNFYSLNSTSFTVANAAAVNTNAVTYYYVAFKTVSGAFAAGTYAGNGTSQNITTTGLNPVFAMTKSAGANAAVFNETESFGDSTSFFTNTANATTHITSLGSAQFSVGAGANSNTNLIAYNYIAIGGASTPSGSGTFTMATGSYTGNGSDNKAITGVGFRPDLVIIKSDAGSGTVYRMNLLATTTINLSLNSAATYNQIKSLDSDGFTLGTNATVNTNAQVYRWQAFGNAFNPETNTGAADFAIGVYYGNGLARSVTRVPFQPDLLVTRSFGATWGIWKTSSTGGTVAMHFAATADIASGAITSLDSAGFTLGTDANVNTSASNYYWFAFKTGTNFKVGSYTGSAGHSITGLTFQPDLTLIKQTGAVSGVHRSGSIATDNTQYFSGTSNAASRITTTTNDGFTVGNNTETDSSGVTYRYAAWHAKTYAQDGFRFFANAASTDVGSALASQDTNGSLTTNGQQFRLRELVHASSSPLYKNGQDFKLQYVDKGSGTCASPSGGTPSSYTDVTSSTLVAYNTANSPADGATLTSNASDPTHGSETIHKQTYEEANNFTDSVDTMLLNGNGMWDYALIDNGTPASTNYCFKVVKSGGTALDSYPHYPMITTVADKTAPVFSSTLPASSTSINSISSSSDVSYTLSEAIASGTITVTRTSGTSDGSSPHTCTLVGTALNSGAHNNFDMTNTTNGCSIAQTLVDGAVYTFAFNGTDAAANAATTVSATSVTYDTTAPAFSSVLPASSTSINSITSSSDVSYTLSEAITSGTIVFTRTGGTTDGTTHTCTLKGTALNSGAHNNLDLSDTTNGCTSAQSLVNGTIYTVNFDATDAAGNTATQVSRTSVTYDTTSPTISGVLPNSSSTIDSVTTSSDVSYTLSEAIASGTIVMTRTGGTAASNQTCTLTGAALNTGGHNNFNMSSGCTSAPTLVNGTIYTFAFDATDLAGNTATTVSKTSVTFDNRPTGTWGSAPSNSSGIIPVNITVNDPNGDLSKALIEYQSGSSCTGSWTKATLAGPDPEQLNGGPITASYYDTNGTVDLNNSNSYQIGTASTKKIKTASGANTLNFAWKSGTDAASANGGAYCLRLTVNDFSNDQATPATLLIPVVDNTAPTVNTLSPVDNSTGISATTNLVLTFSEAVTAQAGYFVYIKKTSDDSSVEAIDAGLSQVTGSGTNTITIDPSVTLAGNTEYYIQIDAYAFLDASSNAYAGIADTTSWSFTTQPGTVVLNYAGSGYLVSQSIDVSTYAAVVQRNALRITWSQNIPTGCALTLKVRGTNTGPTADYSTSTPWASATAYSGSGSSVSQDLSGDSTLQGKRFFQYRADLTNCASNLDTPTLYDVQIDFE